MKPMTSICLAFTITLLATMLTKAENWEHPPEISNITSNTQHFGLEASLRYFEDTLIETTTLLKRTHGLLNSIETSSPLNVHAPEYAICKLCGNYEKLLAHIDNLIEGRLYTVLPPTNWTISISGDLERMHCFTWKVIQHLQISQGYEDRHETEEYTSPCTEAEPSIPEWLDTHSKTRESLRLLEVSIEVFRFHIELTREEMNET